MERYIIAVFALLVVAAVVSLWLYSKKRIRPEKPKEEFPDIMPLKDSEMALSSNQMLSFCFNELSALSEEDEMRLAEIKDKNLLAQIDSVIPRTVQAAVNAVAVGDVNDYRDKMKSVGVLYQAIIPKGAVLTESKAMDGAVRGFYRGENGIKGHANLVAVNTDISGNLASVAAVNSVMSVASMVVGEYYMTQINDQLRSVNDKIDKLYKFQDNEFKSKVYALYAEIQKMAVFQYEIMASDEHRKRELAHLKNLEHQCAELLGQANLTIQDLIKNGNLNYTDYDDTTKEIDHWYQYQQMLMELFYRISELTFTMNMGEASRESCEALYLTYLKQFEEVQMQLYAWHTDNLSDNKIDLEQNRRNRQGVEGVLMKIPAAFNHDLKYKAIPESTASMIKNQINANFEIKQNREQNLFDKDVKLIMKDGKMYYLPPEKKDEDETINP